MESAANERGEGERVTPLRQVRTSSNRTLEEVAAATGIDVGTLSRIERGAPTSPETAEKLVRYFGPALIDELRILYPERYRQ
jgi:transcriptional regulator with XRE-family HTH domain